MPAPFAPSLAVCSQRGFTLIEIMVVLVIIGITAGAVGLSISPSPERILRQDARQLAQQFEAAHQAVRTDGRLVAWRADGQGYRFTRGNWRLPPGGVVPEVMTDGALDDFSGNDALRPRSWRLTPTDASPAGPVVLGSEWIGQPWQLVLRHGQASVTIERAADGGYVVR
ncbi:type II secretion system minor pseudopilin GspH [Orrella sp. JC864]|uniref:type II secretion system minor pseudopilin GspH n=1 Tax=Orrella sp. JC864 TaxID=3120298 RepID=UPI00300A0D45